MTAGASDSTRSVVQHKKRRAIRWPAVALLVHNWLGLKLFLVLAIVFLSGTLAVFRYEIDWLIYPELRVQPGESLASLDDILAAVKQAYPEMGLGAEIPTGVGAGNLAIGILGVSPDRGLRLIWVDPYRAIVQGDTLLMTPGSFLAKLHRDLFMQEWGLLIVCALAIVLVVSLVTGLLAYRRFWRGFLRRPRFRTLRISMVDLHKLVGLWSLWFSIVIALTGLWYFWTLVGEPMFNFPQAVERRVLPELSDERLEALGPGTPMTVSLDSALSRVKAAYPDFVSTYVSLPEYHGAPYVFHGNRGEILALNATAIAVDPFSGEILGADLASDAPVGNRIGAMVTPLHYGDFGGIVSKTVWFTFGLALSSLIITGIVIFWCRTVRVAVGFFPTLLRSLHPWRGAMSWLKPLNYAVLVGTIIAAVMTSRFYARGVADAPAHYAPQAVGPWQLGVTLVADMSDVSEPLIPGAPAVAIVKYCTDCWHEIRRLWVEVGPAPLPDDQREKPVQGQPGFAFSQVVMPRNFDAQQRLWLIAEGWDRRIYQSSWIIERPSNDAQ